MKAIVVFVAFCVVRSCCENFFAHHEVYLSKSHRDILEQEYRVPDKNTFCLKIIQEEGDMKSCSCNSLLSSKLTSNSTLCTVVIKGIDDPMIYNFTCTVEADKKRTLKIKLIVLGGSVENQLLSTIPRPDLLKARDVAAVEGDIFVARYFVNENDEIRDFKCTGKTRNNYAYSNGIFTNITYKQDAELNIPRLSPAMTGTIDCDGKTNRPKLPEFRQTFNITVQAKPRARSLNITEGSSVEAYCSSNGIIGQDITFCKWQKHYTNGRIEHENGNIKNENCYIEIDSSTDKNIIALECSIVVHGVTEIPVKYTITMLEETDSKWMLPVGIGAGVVVLLLVVGGAAYSIAKKKNTLNTRGVAGQPTKTLDGNEPRNPERERYSQGPQRSARNDDVNVSVPVAAVAPLPGRKKKKEEKKPVIIPDDDGEGEYYVIGPHGTVKEPNNSQPVHTSTLPKIAPPPIPEVKQKKVHANTLGCAGTLPKIAPPPIPEVQQKKVHANTLEHKRKKPPTPDKPRSETMQSGWPANKKETLKMSIPMNSNFLGELNQKLSKPPTASLPRQQAMDHNDTTSYESIELMDLGDREIKEPLIKNTGLGRKAPAPNPKPKDNKVALDVNSQTLAKKPETERPPLKSTTKRPGNEGPSKPIGNPILSGKPPLQVKPVSAVKPMFSGKTVQDLPSVGKGTWKYMEETDGLFSKESTSKPAVPVKGLPKPPFHSPSLSVRTPMPLPSEPEEDVISQKSYGSVSSDEGYLRPRTDTKPAHTETAEPSSDEEWEQYDTIELPNVYGNLPGSIPFSAARPQSEHIYQDPEALNKPEYKGQSSGQFAHSGAGLGQSGAALGKSGKGPMPRVKGMKNNPLPLPPKQPGRIYSNVDDLQPRGRKGKY